MTDAYVAMGLLQPDLFLGGEMNARPRRRAGGARRGRRAARDRRRRPRRGGLRDRQHENRRRGRGDDDRTAASTRASSRSSPTAPPARCTAVGVARELGIDEVVVPYFPGGFSAFGMIASRSRVEYSQATMTPLDALGPEALDEIARRARPSAAARTSQSQGVPAERDHARARLLRRCTRARARTTACRCRAAAADATRTWRRSPSELPRLLRPALRLPGAGDPDHRHLGLGRRLRPDADRSTLPGRRATPAPATASSGR